MKGHRRVITMTATADLSIFIQPLKPAASARNLRTPPSRLDSFRRLYPDVDLPRYLAAEPTSSFQNTSGWQNRSPTCSGSDYDLHVHLIDLPTPTVLVERSTLRSNISRMQHAATEAGIRLRPHAKTHKSAAIAQWQLEGGAIGITVAKVGEAEIFAEHGVSDIRIAYPLPPSTAPRILALMERVCVSIVVDNACVARCWSNVMVEAGRQLNVLVKVDVGFHRCGIDPEASSAASFVGQIATLPGLRLCGLLSHAGHGYDAATINDVATIARQEAALMEELAANVRGAGIAIDEISVGSTPTARFSLKERVVTELRPGNYVFFDLTQVALGSAATDQCALTVLSTVISRPTRDRLILDAGSKTLSSDRARGPDARTGFGAIWSDTKACGINQALVVERLSEEHAVVAVIGNDTTLAPGDRVRLFPNHACVVVNLTDALQLVDGDTIVETLPVQARGKNA